MSEQVFNDKFGSAIEAPGSMFTFVQIGYFDGGNWTVTVRAEGDKQPRRVEFPVKRKDVRRFAKHLLKLTEKSR